MLVFLPIHFEMVEIPAFSLCIQHQAAGAARMAVFLK